MNAVLTEARRRGITRLCHFTKSANLAHILATGEIRATADLQQSTDGYRPTDDERRDGQLQHVCCSIEYPNAWYLNRARERDPNYLDWVVLTLDIGLLDTSGIKFCSYNAARKGAETREGIDAFESLFANQVLRHSRLRGHPDWWPTDDQAEVLIPGPIPLSAMRNVIVKNETQAELEDFRLRDHLAMLDVPTFVVAPTLFDPRQLTSNVRSGLRPTEVPYNLQTPLTE